VNDQLSFHPVHPCSIHFTSVFTVQPRLKRSIPFIPIQPRSSSFQGTTRPASTVVNTTYPANSVLCYNFVCNATDFTFSRCSVGLKYFLVTRMLARLKYQFDLFACSPLIRLITLACFYIKNVVNTVALGPIMLLFVYLRKTAWLFFDMTIRMYKN